MARKRTQNMVGGFAAWEEVSPARVPLNREQITHQALVLLDEVGFDGLTMRKLAERLGVQAASLYNHVHDKQEVLTLLADTISGEVPETASEYSWRERLEQIGWNYRQVMLGHRDAARVMVATLPVGPKRWWLIEQVLEVFRAGGFSDEDIADATWVFNSYIVGFVLDETQGRSEESETDANEQSQARVRQWFSTLPAERYPELVALADHLVASGSERRFGFGLTALLDGLEVRLSSQRQDSPR